MDLLSFLEYILDDPMPDVIDKYTTYNDIEDVKLVNEIIYNLSKRKKYDIIHILLNNIIIHNSLGSFSKFKLYMNEIFDIDDPDIFNSRVIKILISPELYLKIGKRKFYEYIFDKIGYKTFKSVFKYLDTPVMIPYFLKAPNEIKKYFINNTIHDIELEKEYKIVKSI